VGTVVLHVQSRVTSRFTVSKREMGTIIAYECKLTTAILPLVVHMLLDDSLDCSVYGHVTGR
jgi:hypothetical protein